jgi:hypothetical protein
MPTFMFGSETQAVGRKDDKRLGALQMKFLTSCECLKKRPFSK